MAVEIQAYPLTARLKTEPNPPIEGNIFRQAENIVCHRLELTPRNTDLRIVQNLLYGRKKGSVRIYRMRANDTAILDDQIDSVPDEFTFKVPTRSTLTHPFRMAREFASLKERNKKWVAVAFPEGSFDTDSGELPPRKIQIGRQRMNSPLA